MTILKSSLARCYSYIFIRFFLLSILCTVSLKSYAQCSEFDDILYIQECTEGLSGNLAAGTVYKIRFNLPLNSTFSTCTFRFTDYNNVQQTISPEMGNNSNLYQVTLGPFTDGTAPMVDILCGGMTTCTINFANYTCDPTEASCANGNGMNNSYRPTPILDIDFTGDPDGVIIVDRNLQNQPLERGGNCCSQNSRCIEIQITPDPMTAGVGMSIYGAGAIEVFVINHDSTLCEPGSNYDTLIGNEGMSFTLMGGSSNNLVPFCTPNDPFSIVLCKPGDDNIGFNLASLPEVMAEGVQVLDDVTCNGDIRGIGFDTSQAVTWTNTTIGDPDPASADPGETYLDRTDSTVAVFTYNGPAVINPQTFRYVICGFPSVTNQICGGANFMVCDTASVIVYPLLVATLNVVMLNCPTPTANLNVTISGGSGGPVTYQWYFDDGNGESIIVGANSDTYVATQSGTYRVAVDDGSLDPRCTPVSSQTTFVDVSCCTPSATCMLSDIMSTGCMLPTAITDSSAVFTMIELCDSVATMSVVESGLDNICTDGNGFSVMRTYYLFLDKNGNSVYNPGVDSLVAECPQSIMVNPPLPVLDTPNPLSNIACDGTFPPHGDLNVSSGCPIITVAKDTLPFNIDICNGYTVTYRWIATDNCNNKDTATASFNVLPDTQAPDLAIPATLADIACNGTFPPHADLMATDDCSTVTVAKDTLPFNIDICNGYTVTYRWIATDNCNNKDTATASFNVLPDTQAPDLAIPAALADIACNGTFPPHANLMATDDCSTVTVAKDTLPFNIDICNGYTVTYRWIATDNCNNKDTATASFNVLPDTQAPDLAIPATLADIACNGTFPPHANLMATDDCSTVTVAKDTLPFNIDICNGYTVTYRWIATDNCNNKDTATASFNVLPDTQAPDLAIPATLADIACNGTFPPHANLMATDDCSTVTVAKDTLPFNIDICNGYTVTYRWIATDNCNNKDTATASFNVLPDTQAPDLAIPATLADIACNGTFPPHANLMATDDCSTVTVAKDTLPFNIDICNGYTVTYRWIATDNCNNKDTATASFNVLPDTQAPDLAIPATLADIACNGTFPPHANLMATDDCSTVTVAKDTLPFNIDICNGYTVTYRWIATDNCNNKDTATASFNVLPDTQAPDLAIPASLADIACNGTFPPHANLMATDDCSTVTVAKDTLPFNIDICNGYTVTYRWIATDNCNNKDTATASFNVLPDTQAPDLAIPASLADIACNGTFPPHANLMATDDCSTVTVAKDTLPFNIDICNGYTVTYRWIATDNCNNKDTATASFNVLPDTQAPDLAIPASLADIACNGTFPPHANLMATDDCSTVTVAKDTLPFNIDICNGYTVTYRWIATDNCNNKDTATASFNVLPDTQAPDLAIPASLADIACNGTFPPHANLMATDDCSTVTVAKDTLPFNIDICNGYTVTYRWIATDNCNNKDTATASFNVLPDTQAPDLAIPASLADIACNGTFPPHANLMATDDCSTVTVAKDTLPFNIDICNGYTVTYRWIATDNCNNKDTATASFNVLPDTDGPVCPIDWDQNIVFDTSTCTLFDPYIDIVNLLDDAPSLTDDCTDANDITFDLLSETLLPGVCTPGSNHYSEREVIRTYQFTDACGNVSEPCQQSITYTITECKSLTSFGSIGIDGQTSISIPPGCDPPAITPTNPVEGVCGYVEYMWLFSTETDPNGNPYVLTENNIGTIWFVIPGAEEESFDPGVLSQSTYFIRCARNFTCCDFGGESNTVSILIDPNTSCPITNPSNCEDLVNLVSPDHDLMNQEQRYLTSNNMIYATNQIGQGAKLQLDGSDGSILNSGFTVYANGELIIYNDGCPDD